MKHYFFSAVVLSSLFFGCSDKEKVDNYQYAFIDTNITIDSNVTSHELLVGSYKKYWEAASKGDLNTTYAMELPYLNFLKSFEWYKDFKYDDKHGYKATMLTMSADKKDHDIAFIRSNFKAISMDVNVTEKWIFVNGAWYHYYSQSLLPPPPKPIR